jgi:hypothetical protein
MEREAEVIRYASSLVGWRAWQGYERLNRFEDRW